MFRISTIKRAPFLFSPARFLARTGLRSPVFSRLQSTAPAKKGGLKALVKEYGFSALGVYLAISAIDLPICYVVVHSMGKEQIQYYENKLKQTFGYGLSDEEFQKAQEAQKIQEQLENGSGDAHVAAKDQSWLQYLVSQFSWTEFAIAYGIHKSFIFVRVPLTAAITPGIVGILRRWGFKIGTDKLSTTANIAKDAIVDITASNPKFGVKPGKRKWWWLF